mgnify:CR=1 FL=1
MDGKCVYDKSRGIVSAKTYSGVFPNSPSQLKAAIEKVPVSVSIEADASVFQQYTGGVITSSACGTDIDHAVLAVGFGNENGQDYYLVKNSWGPAWGQNGYVKIGVTIGEGVCGIQSEAVFAKID